MCMPTIVVMILSSDPDSLVRQGARAGIRDREKTQKRRGGEAGSRGRELFEVGSATDTTKLKRTDLDPH